MIMVLDIRWPIRGGGAIPLDHGYALFAAMSSLIPEIHGNCETGIHSIQGLRIGPGQLALTKQSAVIIRTAVDLLPRLIRISGRRITLHGTCFSLGVPVLQPLVPTQRLYCPVASIKGFQDGVSFGKATARQLQALGIGCPARLEVGKRRVLRVKGMTIVGFTIEMDNLSPEESLRVQQKGIGGRRRLGCGLFMPSPNPPCAQPREHP